MGENVDKEEMKFKIGSKETLFIIAFGVIGFYCYNFNDGISNDNGNWGTFGDYFGGILNPITSAFAFYLVDKTYKLQKELNSKQEESQFKQIKLAALTASLNSKLTRVSLLRSEKESIFKSLNDPRRNILFHLEVQANIFNLKFDELLNPKHNKIQESFNVLLTDECKLLINELNPEDNKKVIFTIIVKGFSLLQRKLKY